MLDFETKYELLFLSLQKTKNASTSFPREVDGGSRFPREIDWDNIIKKSPLGDLGVNFHLFSCFLLIFIFA